jgi:molybdenum cofactor cytidylyltransferase
VIPAVVLAAGKSSRMGRSKPLLPTGGGETFLTRIIHTFLEAGVDDIVVVVGHDAESVAAAWAEGDTAVRFVLNPDYESGQLSSLLAGIAIVDRPGVQACLVTLVDVPLVAASTVRAVVERYCQTHAPVVRPVHRGRHGHPVLLDRALFPLLRGADPAAGAKPVIRANVSPAGDVEVDDEGAFLDIDTPEEFERAFGSRRSRDART